MRLFFWYHHFSPQRGARCHESCEADQLPQQVLEKQLEVIQPDKNIQQ